MKFGEFMLSNEYRNCDEFEVISEDGMEMTLGDITYDSNIVKVNFFEPNGIEVIVRRQ